MVKNHLKRLSVPRTWPVHRKTSTFIVRPAGYLETAMPIAVILKEVLGLSKTRLEAKRITQAGKVMVDGRIVKDERRPVPIMSVISIADTGAFRMLLDDRGKLFLRKVDAKHETSKPAKVTSKSTIKGNKIQLGFHDGTTIITDNKDAKVNDTFILKLPERKMGQHLKLQKKARVYLTGGSSVGNVGTIENISGTVTVKIGDRVIETGTENVFVVDDSIEASNQK